jgi:hypothetical protein
MHSFHSLRLMRYISHAFFSLLCISPFNVCLDEIEEAKKAVESYIFHWEKKFTLLLDAKKKERYGGITTPIEKSMGKQSLSHRISGQITQFPDFSTFSFAHSSPIVEEDERDGSLLTPLSPVVNSGSLFSNSPVVIDYVDDESVEDVVGVLITGMRLLLHIHEGNVATLQQAASYGEKAFIIVTEHASTLPSYSYLLGQVYQWLGVVYGELALEVVSREDRLRLQNDAIVMLSKARNLQRSDPKIRYQLALQYAEVGEVIWSLL